MRKSNGKIVDSMIISMIFIVLLPVWLFGNLFVVTFPPKRLKALAAKPKPVVSNISADANDRGVVINSSGSAKLERNLRYMQAASPVDGVSSSSPVQGEDLVPIPNAVEPEEAAKPQMTEIVEEATSTKIAEAASIPVIQTAESLGASQKLQANDEPVRSPVVVAEVSSQTTEGLKRNESRLSPEMRIWKNPAGKEVEGTLVRVMGDRIEFRTKAGRVVTSAVEYFSEADQAYIKGFEHLK